jgi:DNA mismatch repair protein MutL
MNERTIKALPKELAGKIAAGEVVERPLSIVKELLENSIDAGATAVAIEISKGGKEYIRVSDNGCGIPKAQLRLAFTRYATSKISTEEDLDNIGTLGFRGEALASIASVSYVELLSKTHGAKTGARIRLSAGEADSVEDAACEEGTTVIVRDLFFNTPARLKFLKPDNTEAALVTDFVSKMALAYPDIRLRMISNGNILFSTPGRGNVYQSILTVYSPQIARSLIQLNEVDEESGMSIKGYISAPTESKTNRRWQIFFVNGRLIKNKVLENALSEAYRDKLFEGRYPLAFIFLELPFSELDVNIHPHKSEIRFYKEDKVRAFVVRAIRNALLNPESLDYKVPKNFSTFSSSSYAEEKIPKADNIFKALREKSDREEVLVQEEISVFMQSSAERELRFENLELIGQAFDTYLICKDASNIYFIDQHAAHERVMYEKLLANFNGAPNPSQQLLTPLLIELSSARKLESEDSLPLLMSLGFELSEFGPSSYKIEAIPSCLNMSEAEDFINAFFEDSSGRFQMKENEIISKSCKAAVKAHDHLSEVEVQRLFEDLDDCENPFSCPHGRPIFVRFSEYETDRMFKRK